MESEGGRLVLDDISCDGFASSAGEAAVERNLKC